MKLLAILCKDIENKDIYKIILGWEFHPLCVIEMNARKTIYAERKYERWMRELVWKRSLAVED